MQHVETLGVTGLQVRALVLITFVVTSAFAKSYDTSAVREPNGNRLQVHIVPHSHDDSGWLKTVDQYYWGSRQDIQAAGIQYVLDAIVRSLSENPDRRFSFAEMSFFTRWWHQQNQDIRSLVNDLIRDERLNFINGGFVQHDEAAAHYVAMIDQTTRGHLFLKNTFNVTPTIGWQIDPFGHSSTQAGLLGASLGFDAFFFGRADHQDMALRQERKQLEIIWQGTGDHYPSTNSGDVFVGNFASGNYGPPAGFWWEWSNSPDPPIADDPLLDEYNVDERVDLFVQRCYEVANVTVGRDIMLTMGSDFQYANAHVWYKNLDKLIHYVNQDGRIHAFYSSPAEYVAAKHSYQDQTWPVKVDDFFPYADNPHSYWTGYFTSRPTSKWYIRSATAYLQATRQLEAFVYGNDDVRTPKETANAPTTDTLENAVSTCQHHDAITGTAKQHVVNDYHKRIYRGLQEAQHVAVNALRHVLGGGDVPPASEVEKESEHSHRHHEEEDPHRPGHRVQMENLHINVDTTASMSIVKEKSMQQRSSITLPQSVGTASGDGKDIGQQPPMLAGCFHLNSSICHPSVRLSRQQDSVFVVAYNPLAWRRTVPIRVPIATETSCHWKVQGPSSHDGEGIVEVHSEVLAVAPNTVALQQVTALVGETDAEDAGDAEVVFMADLPPLGYSSYVVYSTMGMDERTKEGDGDDNGKGSSNNGVMTTKIARHSVSSRAPTSTPSRSAFAETHSHRHEVPPRVFKGVSVTSSVSSWTTGMLGWIAHTARTLVTATRVDGATNLMGTHKNNKKTISNDLVSVEFDAITGLMTSITLLDEDDDDTNDTNDALSSKKEGLVIDVTPRFIVYNASDGLNSNENRGQASGAYIFRENGIFETKRKAVSLMVREGELVSEAYQVFDEWLTLITRVYKGQPYVEVEWTVGPIPFEDGYGREISIQYDTSVQSGDAWWTDANGRAMIRRKRDSRPSWNLNVTEPIGGNYYPVTAATYIKDDGVEFAVLTDRAQGAASLHSGQLELMLHRRLLVDDWRGVGEALNETVCGCSNCDCPGLIARGVHWLTVASPSTAGAPRRVFQQLLNDPPLLFFGRTNDDGSDDDHKEDHHQGKDPLGDGVDEEKKQALSTTPAHEDGDRRSVFGVDDRRRSFSFTNGHVMHKAAHLLTLMRTGAGRFLVRLAHLVDADEVSSIDSLTVKEDLEKLLSGSLPCKPRAAREMSLSGNRLKEESDSRRLVFERGCTLLAGDCVDEDDGAGEIGSVAEKEERASSQWAVELKPMQVRTFEVEC